MARTSSLLGGCASRRSWCGVLTCLLLSLSLTAQDREVRPRSQATAERRKQDLDTSLTTVSVSADTIARLNAQKIATLRQLRQRIYLKDKSISSVSPTELRKLKRVALLSLLSGDQKLNASLAQSDITSAADLARLSVDQLIKTSNGRLSRTSAQVYKKKVDALRILVDQQARTVRVAEKNPAPVYSPLVPAEMHSEIRRSVSSGETACATCDPTTSVLSPAAYLLYLLDFVEKSFGSQLDTLDKINQRFRQRLEEVSISPVPESSARYIRNSTDVLENLIAELKNEPLWPNQIGTTADAPARLNARVGVYEEFKNTRYITEPGFDSQVLVRLFDSYVREFGTTRRELRLISLGTPALRASFIGANDLAGIDLTALNKQDDQITLRELEGLRTQLRRLLRRRAEGAVRAELVTEIEERSANSFTRHFNDLLSLEIDKVILELVGAINSTASDFDTKLLQTRGAARVCVELGTTCPTGTANPVGTSYNNNPLNPLWELYRYYAHEFDPALTGTANSAQRVTFANTRIAETKKALEDSRYTELVESEGGDASLSDVQRQQLRARAKDFAGQHIRSDQQLRIALRALAEKLLANELTQTDYLDGFNYLVNQRATAAQQAAEGKAEETFLSRIRTNLIIIAIDLLKNDPAGRFASIVPATLTSGALLSQDSVQDLADYLFLDLTVDESQTTTSLAFVIGRVHTLIQHSRLGRSSSYSSTNFNEATWSWLSSYGVWHAAMMVSLYPENFLLPNVRRSVTPQFQALLDYEGRDMTSAVDQYAASVAKLEGMTVVNTIRDGDQTFVFGRPATPATAPFYYSVIKRSGPWTGWHVVPGSGVSMWNFTGRLEAVLKGRFLHLFILATDTHKQIADKFKLKFLTLKVRGDRIGVGDGGSNGDAADDQAEGAWSELGELSISGQYGDPPFAISAPGAFDFVLAAYPIQTVVVAIGENKFIYPTLYLDDNGKLRTFTWPTVADQPTAGTINGNLFAMQIGGFGDVRSIQGVPGSFLWDNPTSAGLHISSTANPIQVGNWNVPLNGCRHRNYSAISATGSANDFFLTCTSGQNAGVQLRHVTVQGSSVTSNLMATIQAPESSSNARTVSLLGDAPLVLLGATKEYYFDAATQKTSAISLPRQPSIGDPQATLQNFTNLLTREDESYLYLEEFYLHAPMYAATALNENQRFEEASAWLKRIYDPFKDSELERIVYPELIAASAEPSGSSIGRWLSDPFDPYALASLNPQSFLVNVKLMHARNFLEWADNLFVRDTNESVNRARELYETAATVLGLHDWSHDMCELGWQTFRTELEEDDDAGLRPGPRAMELIPRVLEIPHQQTAELLRKIVIRNGVSSTLVAAAAESILGRADRGSRIGVLVTAGNSSDSAGEELGLAMVPEAGLSALGTVTIGNELPSWISGFCLPVNPMLGLYRWRIESNLAKIGTNRNFAGIVRQLQPYASRVDPMKLVKAAAAGVSDFEQFIPTSPPPVYRYSFLVERAKYLVSVAQQFEGSMLSALEKADAESYTLSRARQDIRLERGNVTLQSLKVKEASDSVTLAQQQKQRAQTQKDHYEELITEGLTVYEWLSFGLQANAAAAYIVSATMDFTGQSSGMASQAAAVAASTWATFERRQQEWELQKELSEHDVRLAELGVDIAIDRLEISHQEQTIAAIRLESANDTVEFLGNKFTNRELYKWMSKNLRKLYRDQLNIAIATAKAAQLALEFERQTSLDFVGYDYWDDERNGLLGAEKLLEDISKLEQHRLSTTGRKREIEKTISLAAVAPAEFQRFKRTGILDFETQNEGFDGDFPGHYMRLIRDVSVSFIALIPPNEGVHATLSNPGLSRVMVGPPFDEPAVISRLPEAVALSSAVKATGLFELRPDDPLLFPFEGSGVATTWRLEMSRGANRFNFDTIVDVTFTIRYTALEDSSLRGQVLAKMGQDQDGYVNRDHVRAISLRNEFPDAWYALHNPALESAGTTYANVASDVRCDQPLAAGKRLPPHTLLFELDRLSFFPNEEQRRIRNVSVVLQSQSRAASTSTGWNLRFVPADCSGAESTSVRLSTAASTDTMTGHSPYGKWIIQLDTTDVGNSLIYPSAVTTPTTSKVATDWLQDILLIVEYRAAIHYNR